MRILFCWLSSVSLSNAFQRNRKREYKREGGPQYCQRRKARVVVDQALIIPKNYIRQLFLLIAFVQEFELCQQFHPAMLLLTRDIRLRRVFLLNEIMCYVLEKQEWTRVSVGIFIWHSYVFKGIRNLLNRLISLVLLKTVVMWWFVKCARWWDNARITQISSDYVKWRGNVRKWLWWHLSKTKRINCKEEAPGKWRTLAKSIRPMRPYR